MAESKESRRRPRIRKSAPTMRQKTEAARLKSESPKKGKLANPLKKLRLRDRWVIKAIAKPFKLLGRFLRWIIPNYFINSWKELRMVVWPSRLETWRLTLAVFIFAIVFGALVAGVDKTLDELFKKLVLK